MTTRKLLAALALCLACATAPITTTAQTELYPKHFDLEEVTLLDGPMKTAMELNFNHLLKYDTDRLLTPFVRQAGLSANKNADNPYKNWETKHPNFSNWGGDAGFDLSGHVGGHYLSALALAYAACHDDNMRAKLKERMEHMIDVMADCQAAYDGDTEGLYGFIGGQPINDSWRKLYKGDLSAIQGNWGWVPFYCQHKILAGLRDAYLYGGSEKARDMFRKLADWSVNVIARVPSDAFEGFLNCEHGGMNESMLDAYQLFNDTKYMTAAKKFTHKAMLNGMQTLNKTFLDGKHANTQVPKYIGMERIFEQDASLTAYRRAAENFWTDVATNRTVCIGGNSVGEHFLAAANSNRYIDHLDGPESCNTNNMLKLSEMLADRTDDARYADFYEYAMWNHILSTQDPATGGYVYFTTLRPQGYRIYSQPNQGMWCCVGTGMENHSKYGHFIYTHDGNKTLYVNLFTPSRLQNTDFAVTQQTKFPYEQQTRITVEHGGQYTIAIRHPAWVTEGFAVKVNGTDVNATVQPGKASYVTINRAWTAGDIVTVDLPMRLSYSECPNYGDYIAFTYGPILLAAPTTAASQAEADATGLDYERLQNEYAKAGRMDHAPGSMAIQKSLLSAPLLIGQRADVLNRIKPQDAATLTFTIDASRPGIQTYKWQTLKLVPFYTLHHVRYSCYWYQQTPEAFAASSMAQTEAEAEALSARTLDFVAPGEQQSEAGHEVAYSSDSSKGNYNGESYRDARPGGYVEYILMPGEQFKMGDSQLSVMCRFTTADKGRKASLYVDGTKIATITIPESVKNANNGFYNVEYPIPNNLATQNDGTVKPRFKVRLAATEGTLNPGLYGLRLMKDYDPTPHAYHFRASDWTTGDAQRIAASAITYDTENNIIHAKSRGNNNIALKLRHESLDYDIAAEQKYLVVRGTGLSTADTHSYLWWLNGVNHGTQVSPSLQKSITVGEQTQTLIAWDMTSSGLYSNFSGTRPSVCQGQTIFGLTSTNGDGSCQICDIDFVADIAHYEHIATAVKNVRNAAQTTTAYTLQGLPATTASRGIIIANGRKTHKH